ncbi:MAG: hypothetical protein PHR94_14760 [Methylomonas lenta]|nr:hypothetical protein [Methylomonas lenta]
MTEEQLKQINALETPAECRELLIKAEMQKDSAFVNAINQRYDEIKISRLKTEQECENFAKNATAHHRQDLLAAIHRQSIDLSLRQYLGDSKLPEVEIECLRVIYGYEKANRLLTGRKNKANYTWKSVRQNGITKAVDRIVCKTKTTMGFTTLESVGLKNCSFEAVVMKYPDAFSDIARDRAKSRLG